MPVTAPANPPAFVSGDKCYITIGTVTLPSNKWSMPIKGMNKAVPNSRDGRKRIPGLPDMDGGEFMLVYDTANDPTTTAGGGVTNGIKPGTVFTAKFYTDGTHFYSGSFIVDEIGPGQEFDNELQFPVKFSLESGTITYPTYP